MVSLTQRSVQADHFSRTLDVELRNVIDRDLSPELVLHADAKLAKEST